MPNNKFIVPEAKGSLYKFKMETAGEFGVDDTKSPAAKHTDIIVRELIRMGEKKLMDKE